MLLLHGAGLGKWIWDRVLPHLTVPAKAVDLPGRSDGRNPGKVTLEDCIQFVRQQLEANTTIVAHSFSATIAVAAASRWPDKIAGLVIVGGVVPESGKPFLSVTPPPMRWFLELMLRRAKNGIDLPKSMVRKNTCHGLDEATTEMVLQRLTPEAPRLYLDVVEWSLPERMPRTYVKLLDDRDAKPKLQDRIIARIGARVETMNTAHLPMLARPAELAAILNRHA